MNHEIESKLSEYRRRNKSEDDSRYQRNIDVAKISSDKCMNVISRYNIQNLRTNGYWFYFTYSGVNVGFVDQVCRIIVTTYDPNMNSIINEYELKVMEYKDPDLYQEIVREFNYQHFIINGDDSEINVINMFNKIDSNVL